MAPSSIGRVRNASTTDYVNIVTEISDCRISVGTLSKGKSRPGEADHIPAARFLKRFLENDVPWLHVDLSSSRCEGGLGGAASEATGFGVAWGLRMLKEGKFAQ